LRVLGRWQQRQTPRKNNPLTATIKYILITDKEERIIDVIDDKW
jgi:hypothetical protein